MFQHTAARRRLQKDRPCHQYNSLFQHTAARRRLRPSAYSRFTEEGVSTHSRAEAAAYTLNVILVLKGVSTHSRAEAAALFAVIFCDGFGVSTHSRAEAAAFFGGNYGIRLLQFQHTAARRRLLLYSCI